MSEGADSKSIKELFDNLPAEEIESLVDRWIHSERNRKIIKRRLIDGIRYEPLAEEFELSARQIKDIVRKGKEKIFLTKI